MASIACISSFTETTVGAFTSPRTYTLPPAIASTFTETCGLGTYPFAKPCWIASRSCEIVRPDAWRSPRNGNVMIPDGGTSVLMLRSPWLNTATLSVSPTQSTYPFELAAGRTVAVGAMGASGRGEGRISGPGLRQPAAPRTRRKSTENTVIHRLRPIAIAPFRTGSRRS